MTTRNGFSEAYQNAATQIAEATQTVTIAAGAVETLLDASTFEFVNPSTSGGSGEPVPYAIVDIYIDGDVQAPSDGIGFVSNPADVTTRYGARVALTGETIYALPGVSWLSSPEERAGARVYVPAGESLHVVSLEGANTLTLRVTVRRPTLNFK